MFKTQERRSPQYTDLSGKVSPASHEHAAQADAIKSVASKLASCFQGFGASLQLFCPPDVNDSSESTQNGQEETPRLEVPSSPKEDPPGKAPLRSTSSGSIKIPIDDQKALVKEKLNEVKNSLKYSDKTLRMHERIRQHSGGDLPSWYNNNAPAAKGSPDAPSSPKQLSCSAGETSPLQFFYEV